MDPPVKPEDDKALEQPMKIIQDKITLPELKKMAGHFFENMVKGVVDIEREILALDSELHADLEILLLQNGSSQKSLWGINLYPELAGEDFVEFDSMINMRPSQGNKSRSVENPQIRQKILAVVAKRISR